MSWQAYVETSLVGDQIDKACIISVAGDSVWAKSTGFEPKPDEMKQIAALFGDPGKAFGSGFHVKGGKYMTVKCDDRSLYGKQGKEGIVCVKTKQCILIGHHNDQVLLNPAASVVEKLADYLIGMNY